MEITLDQLLTSRDQRAEHERLLMHRFPDYTLVVLTVVIPGSVKRNDDSLVIAHAGEEQIKSAFGDKVRYAESRDLPTGYEAYFLIDEEIGHVKRKLVQIETNHPLGRLMDLDAIQRDGTPFSRGEIDVPPRTCLICGKEVRLCMREANHTTADILEHIHKMTTDYVHAE